MFHSALCYRRIVNSNKVRWLLLHNMPCHLPDSISFVLPCPCRHTVLHRDYFMATSAQQTTRIRSMVGLRTNCPQIVFFAGLSTERWWTINYAPPQPIRDVGMGNKGTDRRTLWLVNSSAACYSISSVSLTVSSSSSHGGRGTVTLCHPVDIKLWVGGFYPEEI